MLSLLNQVIDTYKKLEIEAENTKITWGTWRDMPVYIYEKDNYYEVRYSREAYRIVKSLNWGQINQIIIDWLNSKWESPQWNYENRLMR